MAEQRGVNEGVGAESKQSNNVAQSNGSVAPDATFGDHFTALVKAVADFASELKTDPAVLCITSGVSPAALSFLKPAQVYACLQRHIIALQTISCNLKPIVEAQSLSAMGETNGGETVARESIQTTAGEIRDGKPAARPQLDESIVQIKAGKSEIDRRICAFIERKQLEINENNVREFCNVIDCNQENSCARTDAVFTPYPGFKSHIKVTRVVNTYGPQTRQGTHVEPGGLQQGTAARDCGNPAIEERLNNIETHLRLPTAGPVPLSVYQRLKNLEDRILELEGLSPEYFQSMNFLHKRPKPSASQAYSLTELDVKISAVKSALMKRMSEFRSSEAPDFPF
ncbi:MAP3K12-binding inhibitory protein 1 [Denticeps clupeoides]|uniref:MAP3K12-binding inhibitory protein 1 n=1 Tax=Denticeps clupeoides TaxID=299321 RepID=A0AAY3ZXW0_9TELE|nr:MAP3K12-binding inhibitory protein 1 [Denticeps clupeoides]